MVRAYREAGPFDVGEKKQGRSHNREALPLRRAVVPLRRVEEAAPIAHGPRGLVGLFLKKDRDDLPRAFAESNVWVPCRRGRARMGASVTRLLSSLNASRASSGSVPHRLGLLELVMAANGRATWA